MLVLGAHTVLVVIGVVMALEAVLFPLLPVIQSERSSATAAVACVSLHWHRTCAGSPEPPASAYCEWGLIGDNKKLV